jgi:hypothetical protein
MTRPVGGPAPPFRANAGLGAARGDMRNRGAKAGPDGEVPDTPY